MSSFQGNVILVSGANSGIGEAAAATLAAAGATVYGLARRKDALEAAQRRHPQHPVAARRRHQSGVQRPDSSAPSSTSPAGSMR